jgi:aryl-alcohol dehydrogenase-like predicted oxidoreductase
MLPAGLTLPELALRWILDHEAVTCVIPGAKRPEQVAQNAGASDLPPLSEELREKLRHLYETRVLQHVHHYW